MPRAELMKVAACLIVKNEKRLVAEWMAHHFAVGFDTLIVFDHQSDDGTAALLDDFADRYDVRPRAWSLRSERWQVDAYEAAVREAIDEFDWIGFFDVDEFVVPLLDDDVHSLLARYGDASAIALNWACFGSSGHLSRPAGLTTQSYLHRSLNDFDPNRHVKSFVRPRAVVSCLNPHSFDVRGTYAAADGQPADWQFLGALTAVPQSAYAQVNHYFTRSREEWTVKRARGYPGYERHMSEFDAYDRNEVRDETVLRFAPATLEVLGHRPTLALATGAEPAQRLVQGRPDVDALLRQQGGSDADPSAGLVYRRMLDYGISPRAVESLIARTPEKELQRRAQDDAVGAPSAPAALPGGEPGVLLVAVSDRGSTEPGAPGSSGRVSLDSRPAAAGGADRVLTWLDAAVEAVQQHAQATSVPLDRVVCVGSGFAGSLALAVACRLDAGYAIVGALPVRLGSWLEQLPPHSRLVSDDREQLDGLLATLAARTSRTQVQLIVSDWDTFYSDCLALRDRLWDIRGDARCEVVEVPGDAYTTADERVEAYARPLLTSLRPA